MLPGTTGPSGGHRLDERAWPTTRRLGPWLAVALLVTVFVVPIDSIRLPIPLPVDARPDRIVIGFFFSIALIATVLVPKSSALGGHRYGVIDLAIFGFVATAVLSVAFNLETLTALNEADEAIKKFALLLSFAGFFLFLVNALGPSELPAVVRVLVAIGVLAALGTTFQYATGTNPFFLLSDKLSPPGTQVSTYRTLSSNGRPDITGPARHGLATSTMLAMIMPFAVVGAVNARRLRDRRLFAVAALIIVVGCLTTLRRSGVILPLAATITVVVLGGRRMAPVAGAFVVLIVALVVAVPGTFDQIRNQFSPDNVSARQSIEGRTADYAALQPDIEVNALTGRGYGSYNAQRYRFLDNEYLETLIGVGTVGLLAYLALMAVAAGTALRLARRRRPGPRDWIAVACVGSVVAFALANALFDALAFPQAPYAFFCVLALLAVLRRASGPAPAI